jgi:hypothetical protein
MSGMKRVHLLVLAGALLAPSPTLAAIQVDPDAPAGVQYRAPLERARAEAGGGATTAGAPGSTEEAPLFGEGIKSAKDAGEGEGQTEVSAGGSSSPSASQVSDSGGSGQWPLIALTAAVLAVGAGLGVSLRRRLAAQ